MSKTLQISLGIVIALVLIGLLFMTRIKPSQPTVVAISPSLAAVIPTPSPTTSPEAVSESTKTDLMNAIVSYNSALEGRFKLSTAQLSGDFARFSIEPLPGVQLDPAFGFAQKINGQWKIIDLGTGGDPTSFYKQYNIPHELRDAGY